jgi:curli biogenesis system outer membrane secretion channel CsgG
MAITQKKMKKLIITLTLFLGFNLVVLSQEKTGVGIMPFTYVNSAAAVQDVYSIQEAVTNAFVKTKRFNIVDRSKMDALKKEKDLQKSEDFIDGAVIEQGVALGANFLISGHVISAQAERMETSPNSTTGKVTVSYKAKLAISLKVIDVSTGQVITSETIEPKGGSTLGGLAGVAPSSPEAAISKAIKSIEEKVDEFVNKNFPATFPIVEIQEKDSKGAATKIMIAGGTAFNLKKGDKLKVVEVSIIEVNGKKLERKKDLGELKISKVEDENFSTCSVSSGGIEINSKFEAKAKLLVITKE